MLTSYIQQTRRLLDDQSNRVYTDQDLTAFINTGRAQIAGEGQCVRFLTPSSNGIVSVTLTSGGSGYVAPVVTIGPPTGVLPGSTATAMATVSGGVITDITVTSPGAGYFTAPSVTITDSVGTGAAATAVVDFCNQTVLAQEVYNFSSIQFPANSGINAVLAVRSIALIWGTFRYVVMKMSFSKYQAKVRNYTSAYQYIPAVATQFGQGQSGSLYMFPLPDQVYPMEWDCVCVPNDLATDTDVEAIPPLWTNCVQYYAAFMAYDSRQRPADADRRFKQYEQFMARARSFSQPNMTGNFYGRAG